MKCSVNSLRRRIDSLFALGPASGGTYTRLALQCVRSNDVVSARKLQTHMNQYLYQPQDSFLHNRLLEVYAKSGVVSDACNLFGEMIIKDMYSWNVMLLLYAKTGSLQKLRDIFEEMPNRDAVSFNTAILGFAKCGHGLLSLGAFARMMREGFELKEYTCVSLLNACIQMLDIKRGRQVHAMIITRSFMRNLFICNALTDLYAKCGEIDNSRWLFDNITDKNAVSWNVLISGYLADGQPEKCVQLFHEMQNSGVVPDQFTITNILMVYINNGCFQEARRLFDDLKVKDKICWTAMISAYLANEKEEDALVFFKEMLLQNVQPDGHTIVNIISCISKVASLDLGKTIHGKALEIGVYEDLLVSTAFVDMYCKCGVTKDAWTVFAEIPTPNVVAWNAMIRGYANNGQNLDALDLYNHMLNANCKPDDISLVAVLSACSNAALLEEGRKYFDSISSVHGLKPTLDHYACMVSLLGRSGKLDEAVRLILAMPDEPNAVIWSTVLSISVTKRDIHHGEMSARRLFELCPHNAGPYIMLANLYASCGRRQDAASTRSLLKAKNIKKLPAYSWITIGNELHKFVANDRARPDTKVIYEELNSLIVELQQAGFVPNISSVCRYEREREKLESIYYHSEKLALAFALTRGLQKFSPITILKNIRVCEDCHMFMKFASKCKGLSIVLRDSTKYHHFDAGKCSCNDIW